MRQRLIIRIGHNEFDALKIGADHIVNGITACATAAYDRDTRAQFVVGGIAQTDLHSHWVPPLRKYV
ncbi:hypothetical protein GCM10011497_18820 [Elstera cyanobacteriorum]|nr:hypothetical protein GCM10011497_18820 [Elstera cyanobacteriorum]